MCTLLWAQSSRLGNIYFKVILVGTKKKKKKQGNLWGLSWSTSDIQHCLHRLYSLLLGYKNCVKTFSKSIKIAAATEYLRGSVLVLCKMLPRSEEAYRKHIYLGMVASRFSSITCYIKIFLDRCLLIWFFQDAKNPLRTFNNY